MSRQNRPGQQIPGGTPPASANARGESGASAPAGAAAPIVQQQAQQYLEDNVKAWMQPVQSSSTREIAPLPLIHRATPAEPNSAYQHAGSASISSGSSIITRQALQDHNLALQQQQQQQQHPRASPPVPPHGPSAHLPRVHPAVTSPSSGYSDSYFALSLGDQYRCDDASAAASSMSSKPMAGSFPHSLSFGGCSQHSLMQGTSYSTPCGNSPFGITQPSAAASFFARAAQRLNLSTKKKRRSQTCSDPDRPVFRTNFAEILKLHPPPIPPGLLRNSGRKDGTGIGKVKVMLRMCPTAEASSADASYMTVDSRKKQVTLYDPTVCGSDQGSDRHAAGVAAPKMFAFDAVFSPDDNQAEVCSSSLCEVISSVVGGSDGCLFAYGHSKLGKTSTMVGSSASSQDLGVIPCSIWWLFRAINEHKHRTGARFSVRVSAVEVSGKAEELRDLLADYAAGTEGSGSAPGVYLRDDPVFGTQLMNQSELRAPTAERAAFLLDAALAARTPETDEEAKNAHFLFTLHVYQYRVEKGGRGGVAGGRSRLHLFDLGSCEKMSKSRDGGGGGCLSLSALGNVILALFNGQKHVPYKDSKLTQLLREAVGSVTCRAAMIAHVSTAPTRYPETLATLQLASRIHRLRRKKLKFPTSAAEGGGPSVDDKGVCRPFVRIHAVGEDGVKSGSDQDYTSSSEQSCDTVIFVGSGRGTPIPSSSSGRQGVSSVSPLAVSANTSVNVATGSSKKTSSKTIHNQPSSSKAGAVAAAAPASIAISEERTIDSPNKSASSASEQQKASGSNTVNSSSKKKMSSIATYCSPKHQKLEPNLSSCCSSPKSSKHLSAEASGDSKRIRHNIDVGTKGSPYKSTKSSSADPLRKLMPSGGSTPNSPQSQRKSKKAHKLEHGSGSTPHISQHQGVIPKPMIKEPKPASDETWIDGPRFTKPKFDSRTLHQLQKEKWVDGPGLYGYMDVQKETMVRKWVQDHSKHIGEAEPSTSKEVWIDFPPEEKSFRTGSTSKRHTSSSNENVEGRTRNQESKRDRSKKSSKIGNQIKVEVETHHYAKPYASGSPRKSHREECAVPNEEQQNASDDQQEPKYISNDAAMDLENEGNMNSIDELYRYLESQTSDENSNSSIDFNDNDSEDLSSKLQGIPENDNSTFTLSSSATRVDNQGAYDTVDYSTADMVPMVDCSIQVTEEDIFSSCGYPFELYNAQPPFRDEHSFDGFDHPLRILSAEDLNLASSFTDSRAVSVDLDSLSVPETWNGGTDEIDPDLTLKLLRGHSLQKCSMERRRDAENPRSDERSSFKITARSQTLSAKLERLSRLRELFEKKTDGDNKWKSPKFPDRLGDLSSRENRFFFSNKLHHSADSSLEELRENDANSIHSEPAELDVEKFDLQFNVQPMNGLRLEEFYNRICKVQRFPECLSHFGKPTQIVPPIVKQPKNYASLSFGELKSLKETLKSSKEKLTEEAIRTSSSSRMRWSGSFKTSEPAIEGAKSSSKTNVEDQTDYDGQEAIKSTSSSPGFTNFPKADEFRTSEAEHLKRRSLVEIVHEQRCQVYSEGPLTSTPNHSHHITKQTHRTSKSTKVITEQITNVVSNIEVTELKNESFCHKKHTKKNGSPKFFRRNVTDSGRCSSAKTSKQSPSAKTPVVAQPSTSSPQHVLVHSEATSCSQSVLSEVVSWPQTGEEECGPSCIAATAFDGPDSSSAKSQILCRSASTPTSPFSTEGVVQHSWTNLDYSSQTGTPSYVCYTSSATPSVTTVMGSSKPGKKISKWGIRTSSSGHGSDSSAISADIKETKELLGCLPKSQQFSGTSSGYESMPRDSEGTPLSSSGHESCCDGDGKREARGRKGTRKKALGSGKRSRSVPARPPVTGSPTWQQQQQQQQQQEGSPSPGVLQPMRVRGRLVRDLHDPSLFKPDEDVCCTGLLCCRLLDFY